MRAEQKRKVIWKDPSITCSSQEKYSMTWETVAEKRENGGECEMRRKRSWKSKEKYSCSQTHTSSTFAAKCSFLNSSIQHMLWDLLTVTSLKSLLTYCPVSALYELHIRLSRFLQVRVIASNPRTPQVKGGIALTEFADAEEELWWLTDCKKWSYELVHQRLM